MRKDLESLGSDPVREWTAPQLEKLGTMKDVAAALNAPGNGTSGNGTTPPVS